jgi:lipopolysaccharide/colanic/teichoic acid biosynthesis glycosyltransferase
MKRVFDFTVALTGLIVVSPLLLAVMIAIWLQDFRSPFYIAPRAARGGGVFSMVKFRSMVVNTDKTGVSSTSGDDRRITPVGRFVRAYKIDELIQLWNVLKGDMSFVDPRPQVELDASLALCDESELLAGADAEQVYIGQILPRKLQLSLECARRRNLLSDLAIIFRTLATVLPPARPRYVERIAAGVPPTDPPGAIASKGSRP